MVTELRVEINCEQDILAARRAVRQSAQNLRFPLADETKIAIAASELARNIFLYSGRGYMECREVTGPDRKTGLEMVFQDNGPGIAEVARAMLPGYSTGRGLGMGLIGARRLMDEFSIDSRVGEGTSVRIIKWLQI